jgi:putative flippase GtrA
MVKLAGIFRSELIRFIVVGVVNTGFGYVLYTLFISVGMHYSRATLLALIISLIFGYYTQGKLVFRAGSPGMFLRFLFAWGAIYSVNVAAIATFIAYGFNSYLSGALSVPITTIFSYLTQKYFVFRQVM